MLCFAWQFCAVLCYAALRCAVLLPRVRRLVGLQSRVRTPRRGSGRARIASGMAPIEAHGFFRSRTHLLVYSQKLAPVELPFNTGGAEGYLRSPLTGLKEGCLGYGAPSAHTGHHSRPKRTIPSLYNPGRVPAARGADIRPFISALAMFVRPQMCPFGWSGRPKSPKRPPRRRK